MTSTNPCASEMSSRCPDNKQVIEGKEEGISRWQERGASLWGGFRGSCGLSRTVPDSCDSTCKVLTRVGYSEP